MKKIAFLLPFLLFAKDPSVHLGMLVLGDDKLIPYFLSTIEKLDYEKKALTLQFDCLNENPQVAEMLYKWQKEHKAEYGKVSVVLRDENEDIGKVQEGYLASKADYCFVLNSEVFVLPHTLKSLIAAKRPIVAPMLRPTPEPYDQTRNFSEVDVRIAHRQVKGVFPVESVSHAYLIDLKNSGQEQYISNEQEFGTFLHFSRDLSAEEEKNCTLAGMGAEVNKELIERLLGAFLKDDPALERQVKNFDCSKYALYRVLNRDVYYLDDVHDWVKDYSLKQGAPSDEENHRQFQKYVKPGTVALDIGGCYGVHTLNLARLVGPNGRVITFEPQAKMFTELAINLYLNQAVNVSLLHNALGNSEKWIEMYVPNEDWMEACGDGTAINEGHGTVTEEAKNFRGDKAKMIRLDSLGVNNISFIKLDVEGYEMEVIRGGLETIKRNMPVMLVEIFNTEEKSSKIKEIESLGYMTAQLSLDNYLFLPKATFEKKINAAMTNKAAPHPLSTKKSFKFLCVEGDLNALLRSYFKVFTAKDDVSLVLYDKTGQLKEPLAEITKQENAPEIVLVEGEIDASSLLKSVDCLTLATSRQNLMAASATNLPVITTETGPYSGYQIPTFNGAIDEEALSAAMTQLVKEKL